MNTIRRFIFLLPLTFFTFSCVTTKQFEALQAELKQVKTQLGETETALKKTEEKGDIFDRKIEKYKSDNEQSIEGLERFVVQSVKAQADETQALKNEVRTLDGQLKKLGMAAGKPKEAEESDDSKKKKNAY